VRPKIEQRHDEYDEVKATLLSLNGSPVWKIGNEVVTGLSYESIRFPNYRKIYTSGPRCYGRCKISGARRHKVEASYLLPIFPGARTTC